MKAQQSIVPGVREISCECEAGFDEPCSRDGRDHLSRYVRAEQIGTVSRAELVEVILGLDVIAPEVLIP